MAEKLLFQIEVLGTDKQKEKLGLLEKQLKKVGDRRKELIKKQRDGNKLTRDEVKELGLLNVRNQVLTTQKQALTQTLKQETKALTSQDGSMAALRARTALLRAESNKLNLTTKAGKQQFEIYRKEIQQNAKKIRDFDRSLSGSRELVGEYSRGIRNSFTSIGSAIGLTFGAAGAVRTIKSGTDTLREFDKGVRNVLTLLSDADRLEFGKVLEEGALQIVRDYGLEVQDVNKALFDAISAGIPAADAIDFLNETTRLAIGGVTDLGTAVDGTTSILNAYGLQMSETEKVTSAFFSAQKFGKTTVAELSQEVGRVAPIAKQARVSYQELLSTFAILTKQGIQTTEATTAIKAAITALIKPAAQVIDKVDELNKRFPELDLKVGASAVQQQGLFNILAKISKVAQEDADALTALIPNVRALTGVGALGEAQLKEYAEILEVVNADYGKGSSLAKGYEINIQSLDVRIRQLSQRFKTGLAGYLGRFIDWGEENIELLKTLAKVVVTLTTTFIAYKAAVKAVSLAVGIYNKGTKIAKASTVGLNAVLKASPWGQIAALVGAAVSAYYLFRKQTDDVVESQKTFNEEITSEQANFKSLITQLNKANEGTRLRSQLINEINSKYGSYFENQLTEKSNLEDILTIQKQVNEAISETIAIKSRSTKVNAVFESQIKREQAELEKLAKTLKVDISVVNSAFTDFISSAANIDGKLFAPSIESFSALSDKFLDLRSTEFRTINKLLQARNADQESIDRITESYSIYIKNVEDSFNVDSFINRNIKTIENFENSIKNLSKTDLTELQSRLTEITKKNKSSFDSEQLTKYQNAIKLVNEELAEGNKPKPKPVDDKTLSILRRNFNAEQELKRIQFEETRRSESELTAFKASQLDERLKFDKKYSELTKQEIALREEEIRQLQSESVKQSQVAEFKQRLETEKAAFDSETTQIEAVYKEKRETLQREIIEATKKNEEEKTDVTKEAVEKKYKELLELDQEHNDRIFRFQKKRLEDQLAHDIIFNQLNKEEIETRNNEIVDFETDYYNKREEAARKAGQKLVDIEKQTADAIKKENERLLEGWITTGEQLGTNLVQSMETIEENRQSELISAEKALETALEQAKTEEEINQLRIDYAKEISKINRKAEVDTARARKDAFNEYVDQIKQTIKAEISKAVAVQIGKIIWTIPWPFNLIVASGAGAIVGALFESIVPKFSRGKGPADENPGLGKIEKIEKYATGKGPDEKGYIVTGPGSERSDNILSWLSPGEAVINAYSMKERDVLTVTGTPREIASTINSYKNYGNSFAYGHIPTPVTPSIASKTNEVYEVLADKIIKGWNNKKIFVTETDITDAQKAKLENERIAEF